MRPVFGEAAGDGGEQFSFDGDDGVEMKMMGVEMEMMGVEMKMMGVETK